MMIASGRVLTASGLFGIIFIVRLVNSSVQLSKVYVSSWAIQLQSSANDEDARSIAVTVGLKYEKVD